MKFCGITEVKFKVRLPEGLAAGIDRAGSLFYGFRLLSGITIFSASQSVRPVTAYRDPVHDPQGMIIINGVMLRAAIIPECD